MSAAHRNGSTAGLDIARWAIPIAIAAVTAAVFLPVLDNGFLEWGDRVELVENPRYRGLTNEHLSWMFGTFLQGHYQPLTWLSFAVDHVLWGVEPGTGIPVARGYHATALLLHVANVWLVYLLIQELLQVGLAARAATRAIRRAAAFGALLFALHPLRVESVAWTVERRGLLSTVFVLLSVLLYSRSAREPDRRRVLLSLSVLAFGLSLLAKELAFTLPAVLVALDVYPLRRIGGSRGWFVREVWLEKLPFVLVAAAAAGVALRSSETSGVARSFSDYGLPERIGQSFAALGLYFRNTVWPDCLSPLYEIPPEPAALAPRIWFGVVSVTLVSAASVWVARRRPAVLTTWVVSVILLSPVLGLLQTGRQWAADRYTYLPAIGLATLIAAALVVPLGSRRGAGVVLAVGVLVLGVSGIATRNQVRYWHDDGRLWAHAVECDPASATARVNLAVFFDRVDRPADAESELVRAIALDPKLAPAQLNLGALLARRGETDGAVEHLSEALSIDPEDRRAWIALTRLRLAAREYGEALRLMRGTLERWPDDAETELSLAWRLATCPDPELRDGDESRRLAEHALARRRSAQGVGVLAAAHAELGRFDRATAYAEEAQSMARDEGNSNLEAAVAAALASYRDGRVLIVP